MNRHLTGVMIAVFAAMVLITAPALADHRPGNVVVMGGTLALTGGWAVRGGRVLNGRKLYVDELNARGGLLGHKVELKIYDDKFDRRTAVELYGKLITKDKVDLILGPYGSGLTDPAANVMERYKRPFVAQSATNPVIWQRGRKYRRRGDGVLEVGYAGKRVGNLAPDLRPGQDVTATRPRACHTGLKGARSASRWLSSRPDDTGTASPIWGHLFRIISVQQRREPGRVR